MRPEHACTCRGQATSPRSPWSQYRCGGPTRMASFRRRHCRGEPTFCPHWMDFGRNSRTGTAVLGRICVSSRDNTFRSRSAAGSAGRMRTARTPTGTCSSISRRREIGRSAENHRTASAEGKTRTTDSSKWSPDTRCPQKIHRPSMRLRSRDNTRSEGLVMGLCTTPFAAEGGWACKPNASADRITAAALRWQHSLHVSPQNEVAGQRNLGWEGDSLLPRSRPQKREHISRGRAVQQGPRSA